MGLFNTLTTETKCANCQKLSVFELQFKYGETWQYNYTIGDIITWGKVNVGLPHCQRVRIEAISNKCPHCLLEGMEYDIILEDDRLVASFPVGNTRENQSDEGFTVE